MKIKFRSYTTQELSFIKNSEFFSLDRLDERETLYTINFTKVYQKSFLYT